MFQNLFVQITEFSCMSKQTSQSGEHEDPPYCEVELFHDLDPLYFHTFLD